MPNMLDWLLLVINPDPREMPFLDLSARKLGISLLTVKGPQAPVYRLYYGTDLVAELQGPVCRFIDGKYKGGRGKMTRWLKRFIAPAPESGG